MYRGKLCKIHHTGSKIASSGFHSEQLKMGRISAVRVYMYEDTTQTQHRNHRSPVEVK